MSSQREKEPNIGVSSDSPSSHLKARREKIQKLINMQNQQHQFLQAQLSSHNSNNKNNINNSNEMYQQHTRSSVTEQHPSSVVQPPANVLIEVNRVPLAATSESATLGNLSHTYSYQSLSDYNQTNNLHESSPHSSDKGMNSTYHLRPPTYLQSPATTIQGQQQYYTDIPSGSTYPPLQQEHNTNYHTQSYLSFKEYSTTPGSFLSCWDRCIQHNICFTTDNLHKSFCFGAIDGMLTGSGITAACAGLGLLTTQNMATTTPSFFISTTNIHLDSLFSLFINTMPPSCLLVLALCIAACSSDAICIAIGHIWSTRILLHAHARRKKDELQSFYYYQNDSKARLATSLISRGMLKIDAVTIVDVLSGYPDLFINALVSDSQAVGASIFGSVNGASTVAGSNEDTNTTKPPIIHPPGHESREPSKNHHHHYVSSQQSQSNDIIPNHYSSNYGSIVGSSSMRVKAESSNPIQHPHHGRYESESRNSDTNNHDFFHPSDYPLYPHTSSSIYPYHTYHQHSIIEQNHPFDTTDDVDVVPTAESSLVHKATQESWMEGFCIMISFSLFSVLPCTLYVLVSFLLSLEYQQVAIVVQQQRVPSLESGSHTYPYSSTNSNYPDYISPTSVTLIISSITMFLLGVWKSHFFSADPLLFGIESLAVFYCGIFFAYCIGYCISLKR